VASPSTQSSSEPGAAAQHATVLGVVIAGILVSFAAAGPYSWASTLIGVVLLALLVGYGGGWPSSELEAVGYAAAVAFTVVLALSLPFEWLVDAVSDADYIISGFDADTPPSVDVPARSDGLGTAIAWLMVFAPTAAVTVRHAQRDRGRSADGAARNRPAQSPRRPIRRRRTSPRPHPTPTAPVSQMPRRTMTWPWSGVRRSGRMRRRGPVGGASAVSAATRKFSPPQ
jgi:hypothetical protein